ncbi:MAG: glutathione S-transferase N-terminal domain-containing protein [Candidatus Poseidoniaceae archaeon]|nr:glutathione S-transferase N-terminal domain-containing protein [Candidatus Poseidoniaceae archaeon]
MTTALPILYSFRRCPYAIRARMSIVRKGFKVEHREVVLRDRPAHMMQISPKGTVPVLLLPDGTVIEESLEIMQYVLDWQLSKEESIWIERNDFEFKFHLDRYKYPNRYEDIDVIEQRNAAVIYLDDLDANLQSFEQNADLNDSLFPFVRQFANHDREWFDIQPWTNIHNWLANNLASDEFKMCMKKNKQWFEGDSLVEFPN